MNITSLHHDNIIQMFGSFGPATLWQLATGLPWNLALATALPRQKCKIALQVSAASRCLIQHVHPMWDVHESDIVIQPQTTHLTFLEVFVEPNEVFGCLYTLPPELRAAGPNRRQAIGARSQPG